MLCQMLAKRQSATGKAKPAIISVFFSLFFFFLRFIVLGGLQHRTGETYTEQAWSFQLDRQLF